jgi:hypothetical protein
MSKKIKSITNPKLSLNILTPGKRIHEATLQIIENTGVPHPGASEICRQRASVDHDR